jgi:hypothetical protein
MHLSSPYTHAAHSARFAFAQDQTTVGQLVRAIALETLYGLLKLVEQLLARGYSCAHILRLLMPA